MPTLGSISTTTRVDTETDVGVRYVVATGGSDTNSGLSWTSAYATLSKAVSDGASSGTIRGMRIMLGPGDHNVPSGGYTVDREGIIIQGVSPRRTRLLVPSAAPYGLRITASWTSVRDLKVQAASNTALQKGILIDTDSEIDEIYNVWFQDFGGGIAATTAHDIEAGPAALHVEGSGTSGWSDWHKFRAIEMQTNYRGFTSAGGGANGMISQMNSRGNIREAVYCRRMEQAGLGAEGAEWSFSQCYFAGTSDTHYLVRIEADPALTQFGGVATFHQCKTEPSPESGGSHFYINSRNNMWSQHRFLGGGKTGTPPTAILFEGNGTDNIVDSYFLVNSGQGLPVFTDTTGGTNYVWSATSPGALANIQAHYS